MTKIHSGYSIIPPVPLMAISTHDFSCKVHMYYSTATDPSRLFSRTFHAVLLLNYSNNPRVTVNKEPAQCCRHIVSHTTMHNLE